MNKFHCLFSLLLAQSFLCVSSLSAKGPYAPYKQEVIDSCPSYNPINVPIVFIDTDMATDSDDWGALGIAFAMHKAKVIKLIGIAVNGNASSADSANAFNIYWDENIPIGTYQVGDSQAPFILQTGMQSGTMAKYPSRGSGAYPSALSVYDAALSGQAKESVTVVSIGFLNNVNSLMVNRRDLLSKVKYLSLMGGSFPSGGSEYNIKYYSNAAQNVMSNWPTDIYVTGVEAGSAVQSGCGHGGIDPWNPVYLAYQAHTFVQGPPSGVGFGCNHSYDQIALLSAVLPGECLPWHWEGSVNVSFENGWTSPVSFGGRNNGGNRYFASIDNSGQASQLIDLWQLRSPSDAGFVMPTSAEAAGDDGTIVGPLPSPEAATAQAAAAAAAAAESESESDSEPSTATSDGDLSVGDWALALDPSVSQWKKLGYVEKVASSINEDIVNVGGGWFWGAGNNYFFFDDPYIYNATMDTWFYTVYDDSGVYYYNFGGKFWDWRSRDGNSSGL